MPSRYDVFLSHSSADKPAVEEIARRLREAEIEPFLDKWHLVPGEPWQEALEEALKQSDTCAVFLGPSGMGPWQNEEMRVALDRRTRNRELRVIPVLLPQARYPKEEEIPPFLTRLTWVDFRSGLDDEDAFRRLIAGVRGKAPGPGKGTQPPISNYRSMPIPPEGFVHRKEYDQVVEALCSENPHKSTVGITTALRGAGGFGKTALAQAVCQDERVRKKYPDGILWTTMGEEVSESGRLSRLRDLIRWWTEAEPPVFERVETASAFLRDLLAKCRVLLVVDDVWSESDLIPFQGSFSALLITTREKDILPRSAERIDVDAMEIPEAVNLLGANLPKGEISTFKSLAQRLGEWPLLLTLVNRQLREMVEEDGFTIAEALRDVESTLQAVGLTGFDRENSQSRQSAVAKTLAVSMRRLQDSELARYRDLAVFPEDVEIPISVLERFWGSSRAETERLCRRLDNLSLLLRFDRRKWIIQIHDVVRHYLVLQEGGNAPNLHRRFLEALRPQSGFWADLTEEEVYLWRHMGYHLLEAGEKGVLRDLLLGHSYLQAKLRATDINALIADYDPFVKEDEELRLIQGSIWMSAHILAKDPGQLAPHLLGRLLGGETAGLKHLLEQCLKASRLRPQAPSFRPPGPLLRTIEVGSSVNGLITMDRRRVVSSSADSQLRVWDLVTGHTLGILHGSDNLQVNAMVVVDDRRAVSSSKDGVLQVWDLKTGRVLRTLRENNDWIFTVAVVDSQRVVSGSADRILRIWDLETGQIQKTLGRGNYSVTTVAVVDRRHAVSGSSDGTLRIWDLETGEILRTIQGHNDWVRVVVVVDRRRAISSSDDGILRVWNLETGQGLQTLEGHNDRVFAVAVVDDQRAISGSDDGTLRVWNLETGELVRTLRGHEGWVKAVTMVDGRHAVSGSSDGTLRVWDLEAGQTLPTLQRHTDVVRAVAAVDGHCAISGSWDGTLRVWDLKTGRALQTLQGHTNQVSTLAVVNSHCIISGSTDRTLRVWDLETGQTLQTLEGHTAPVRSVSVVDNRCAVSCFYDDETLRVWSLETGQTLRILKGHKESVNAVALVDGRHAVSGSSDGTLRVWDLETGQALKILEEYKKSVSAMTVVDGRYAVSGFSDGALWVWDLVTGQTVQMLGHTNWVQAVEALNNQRVVSSSHDGTLRFWELETGRILHTLEGHTDKVSALAIVDSQHAVSGSEDKTLRAWDLETGECLAVLVLEAEITSVTVAPDRRTVVVGDQSGGVHFLQLDIDTMN